MANEVFDRLVDRAWPAIERVDAGGWSLRAAAGVTKRANSVLPLGERADLAAAIGEAEEFYADRGLPCVFSVGGGAPSGLDAALEARGYRVVDPTLVMTAPLDHGTAAEDEGVELAEAPSQAWLDAWWSVDGRFGDDGLATAARILTGVPPRTPRSTGRPSGGVWCRVSGSVSTAWPSFRTRGAPASVGGFCVPCSHMRAGRARDGHIWSWWSRTLWPGRSTSDRVSPSRAAITTGSGDPTVGLPFVVAGARRGVAETCRLVLDVGTLVSQHGHVLPPVVGAEQQLPTDGQGRADVGLGAAPVTAVRGRQLLGGGEGSSHVSPFRSSPEVEDLASVT